MPIDIKDYEKKFLEDYNNNDFEVTLTKYRKKKIVELLNKYHGRRILEIGCGMEPFFLSYDEFDYMTVVEPADIMYESAKRYRNEYQCKNIECIHDFVENQVDYLKAKKFDTVLLIGLIHETEQPDLMMDAVRNICSKNTKLILMTNNPKSFHLMLAYESGIIPNLGIITPMANKFQRKSVFYMEDMLKFATDRGFNILEKGSHYIKPFSHKQMKMLIDNNIITQEVLDGLEGMIKYIPELGAEIYCVAEL